MSEQEKRRRKIGVDTVVYGNVSKHVDIGNRSVVMGATDNNGNTILNKSMTVGYRAQGGSNSIVIGA